MTKVSVVEKKIHRSLMKSHPRYREMVLEQGKEEKAYRELKKQKKIADRKSKKWKQPNAGPRG